MAGQILFIVWRESVEALLVVGILHAWLRADPGGRRGLRFLWGGVLAGVAGAGVLALAILRLGSAFAGAAQDGFQAALALSAAGLIVQMVFWLRRAGRNLKHTLEAGLQRSVAAANWLGVSVVAALAVMREGSEMVVFLYGLGLMQRGPDLARFLGLAALGLGLAGATFGALQVGGRRLSWKLFFRLSEAALLFLAAALLVSGLERLEALGWLPTLRDPVWNSAWLLDDGSRAGGLVAALTGYRAQPSLSLLLAYGLYWTGILALLRRGRRPAAPVAGRA